MNPWTGAKLPETTVNTPIAPVSTQNDAKQNTAPTETPTTSQKQTPYQKGQEGVKRAEQEIESQGGIVLSREVTLEVNGVRVRVDIAAEFNGAIELIEVKNGPHASFTPNQKIVYPQMIDGIPIIPRGKNALTMPQWQIGQPTTQYYLRIIKY